MFLKEQLPQEYLDYLIYFHAQRDYFECHEILEEYWKQGEKGARKKVWVGLIQIAVSLYHHRRNNFFGALRMMKSAYSILQNEKEDLLALGFRADSLLSLLERKIKDLTLQKPYESIHLPLHTDLVQHCHQLCNARKLRWGSPSDLENVELINKHTLRDRREVIQERQRQKYLRKNNRGH